MLKHLLTFKTFKSLLIRVSKQVRLQRRCTMEAFSADSTLWELICLCMEHPSVDVETFFGFESSATKITVVKVRFPRVIVTEHHVFLEVIPRRVRSGTEHTGKCFQLFSGGVCGYRETAFYGFYMNYW